MRQILITALALLASCSSSDWKAAASADGEREVREDLGKPTATFSKVQVVGDDSTGQICGLVLDEGEASGSATPVRFIVYIDHSAGPWIEGQRGHETVSDAKFNFAWTHDCIGEGWQRS